MSLDGSLIIIFLVHHLPNYRWCAMDSASVFWYEVAARRQLYESTCLLICSNNRI